MVLLSEMLFVPLFMMTFSLNLHHRHKPVADVSHTVPVPTFFYYFHLLANFIFISVLLAISFFSLFLSQVFSSLEFIHFSFNFLFHSERYSFDN